VNIAKLETFANEFVCFVKLTTDSGAVGFGQTSTYNADITASVFHRQVAPWVLGQACDDIGALITRVEEKEHKYPGSYRCRALAGLDTAWWDLQGKLQHKPVVALLGGKPGRLRAYASSMKRDISPKDEAKRLCELRDCLGFDAFKWRVAAECGRDVDEWPGRTEEIIPTVSKALGSVDKLVDANSGFSVKRAIEVGKLLSEHGVGHFEEPCPYWQFEQTRQVRAALDIDVTGGEQDWDLSLWERMMADNVVDVVQPDVMYLGGLWRTLKVVALAKQYGLPVTPHSANLSLVTMCTMHLLGAIDNAGPYLELSIEGADYYPWQQNLFLGDPYKVVDGHVTIPAEPGFGVSINPAWLERARYQISESA
jgi:L-alanine-DL-glutamate epimerase-like enolase superfamily enzyme